MMSSWRRWACAREKSADARHGSNTIPVQEQRDVQIKAQGRSDKDLRFRVLPIMLWQTNFRQLLKCLPGPWPARPVQTKYQILRTGARDDLALSQLLQKEMHA